MKKSLYLLTAVVLAAITYSCENDGGDISPGGGETGTGGSLARFTISGDYLYAVDATNLVTFSLQNPLDPKKVDQFPLEWGVETIFAMDTVVFVGTQTGMHMFDITDGSRPGYLSNYEHIQSCDPVVAQDTLAFVTLRSGNGCWNGVNRLDVIDIRDLNDPQLLKTYDMENPFGLGVHGNLLFVCEGNYGLKVFDILESGNLELIKFYQNIRSQDVIILPDSLLLVSAQDGLFQYDYSDVSNLEKLSEMRIEY